MQRSGTVTVVAAPVNSPPVINQLNVPGSANVGDVVNFSASVSDQNNDPLTCTWLFGDGSQQNTNCTGGSTSVNYTYNSANSYTVTLRVDDGNNPFVEQSQNISIQPPPVTPPTANAGGPYSGSLMGMGMGMGGVTITFDGSGSINPSGAVTAMTFTWTFSDGGSQSGPGLISPTRTYSTAGCYSVELVVNNGVDSIPATAQVSITSMGGMMGGGGGCP